MDVEKLCLKTMSNSLETIIRFINTHIRNVQMPPHEIYSQSIQRKERGNSHHGVFALDKDTLSPEDLLQNKWIM